MEPATIDGVAGAEIATTSVRIRPIPIYFIACWSFLVLTLQSRGLARAAELYLSTGQDAASLWGSFRGLLLILVVWHALRLIRLKPLNRWLSVVSFFGATVSAIYFLLIGTRGLESPIAPIVGASLSGLLSLTSGLYLAHKRFRECAVQFVLEREKEKNSRMMQKTSQKAILDGLEK
jgi:hypothetical protein